MKDKLYIFGLVFVAVYFCIMLYITVMPSEDTLTINFEGIENIEDLELTENSLAHLYINCVKHCQEHERSSSHELKLCYEACGKVVEMVKAK